LSDIILGLFVAFLLVKNCEYSGMMDNNRCTLQNTWTYKLEKQDENTVSIKGINPL
jgi:hypothetical protein